jgi:hypothetical protein
MSQLPFLIENGTNELLKVIWILPFTYLFLCHYRDFLYKPLLKYYILFVSFFLYLFLLSSVGNTNYLGPDIYNIMISLAICVTSFVFWRHYANERFLNYLTVILLICVIILSLNVYFDFLRGVSILSKTYAFANKNSMGQIILASLLIAFINNHSDSKSLRMLLYGGTILGLVVMFMMKSRATIAGFAFLLFYFAFLIKNIRLRFSMFFLLVVGGIYIVYDSDFYNTLVNGILLGGRSINNIDDISSGRLTLITKALKLYDGHFWLGIGNYYIDCMPVAIVVQFGVLGSLFIFIPIVLIGYYCTVITNHSDDIYLTAFLLFWIYMINALFEAQPPFGPGVKCFLFWMILGFSLANHSINDVNVNE